jgi:tetratricopeptide (TPR) repeat protein
MSCEFPRKPALAAWYETYLDSLRLQEFVHAVSARYSVGTLERLATSPDPPTRRAAIFALGLIGDFSIHHVVGQALLDQDRVVRLLAERGSRFVWSRDGTAGQRRLLAEAVRLNTACLYRRAFHSASQLIDEFPEFAEAWYQRGAACFELKRYRQAIHNWHRTLELNAYHFLAAGGIGHALLQLDEPVPALVAFRRALRIYPEQESIRRQVEQLTSLGGSEE